jgi:hypothetical protein
VFIPLSTSWLNKSFIANVRAAEEIKFWHADTKEEQDMMVSPTNSLEIESGESDYESARTNPSANDHTASVQSDSEQQDITQPDSEQQFHTLVSEYGGPSSSASSELEAPGHEIEEATTQSQAPANQPANQPLPAQPDVNQPSTVHSAPVGQQDPAAAAAAAQQAAHDTITAAGVSVRGRGYENIAPIAPRPPNKLQKTKYKELGMVATALTPDALTMNVKYLDPETREGYRLNVSGGLLRDQQGNPYNTGAGHSHMVVMDNSGRIYAGSSSQVKHHSAFLSGNPVAAAGMITVENGEVTGLHNESGHYQMPKDYFQQLHTELKAQGVQIRPGAFASDYPTSKETEKMRKRLAGKKPANVEYSEGTFTQKPVTNLEGTVVGHTQEPVATGTSKPGQVKRLYPSGPKWGWF